MFDGMFDGMLGDVTTDVHVDECIHVVHTIVTQPTPLLHPAHTIITHVDECIHVCTDVYV